MRLSQQFVDAGRLLFCDLDGKTICVRNFFLSAGAVQQIAEPVVTNLAAKRCRARGQLHVVVAANLSLVAGFGIALLVAVRYKLVQLFKMGAIFGDGDIAPTPIAARRLRHHRR